MRPLAVTVLIAFATIALAACGGGASPTPASSTAVSPSVVASNPANPASGPAASGGGASAGAAACASAPAGAAAATTVTIKGFAYSPQPVQAKVGDVVAWKNDDTAPHSATMDDGSCDTDTIAVGATAMLVFSAAGTYTYHCKIHPGQMKDVTVEVK